MPVLASKLQNVSPKTHRESIPTFECIIVRVASYSEPGTTFPFPEETNRIKLPARYPMIVYKYAMPVWVWETFHQDTHTGMAYLFYHIEQTPIW